MTKSLPTLIALIIFQLTSAQVFNTKEGIKYFIEGSKALQSGDYSGADSLITIALCSYENENVYFNRAIARLHMKDTIGFCDDLYKAANNYLDQESAKLFTSNCCSYVDTFYYDRKFQPTSKLDYRYLEEIRHAKYDNTIMGFVHDAKHSVEVISMAYNCNNNLSDIGFKKTDITAVYIYSDTTRYYLSTRDFTSLRYISKYKTFKNDLKLLFAKKYDWIKMKYNIESLSVLYKVFIDARGNVANTSMVGLSSDLLSPEFREAMSNEINKLTNHYPPFRPAKFKKNKVNSIVYDSIEF